MDDAQVGRRYRALRHRLGWRQVDIAARAGVSHSVISLLERGRLEEVTLRKLRRVARELDAEFTTQLRWRAGDLDRLLDEGHATLAGRVAELLRADGWDLRIEVSYSIYGERGSIDTLAKHPRTGTLLVVEVKTELMSVEETLRKHDAKVRLAPRIATDQFGWAVRSVARLLVLPSTSTARRRVERHVPILAQTYPHRGHELRSWLKEPTGSVAGILFLDGLAGRRGGGGGGGSSRRRIRMRRAKVRQTEARGRRPR